MRSMRSFQRRTKYMLLLVTCLGTTVLVLMCMDTPLVITTCDRCFISRFRYLQNNSQICEEDNKSDTVDVLFLIFTVHGNQKARDAIRETWMAVAKQNRANIRYTFLLGELADSGDGEQMKAVLGENNRYHDIIIGNFTDSYRNLTFKTLMGLHWAVHFCSNAKTVVKTDDDMFIHVPNLLNSVSDNKEYINTSMLGYCFPMMAPLRNSSSKWYTSIEQYPFSQFPRFCSGTCYVTGIDMIKQILAISVNVPFFYLEDVYIGMCLKVLNLEVTHVDGFKHDANLDDICDFKNTDVISFHGLDPELLRSLWNTNCIS